MHLSSSFFAPTGDFAATRAFQVDHSIEVCSKSVMVAQDATMPMAKKFPQLKDIDKAPELASVMPRYTAVKTRMETVMTKFLTSPEFVEAMQKISTVEK